MTEDGLTRERILDAAEEVLRRYGPAKATVVDVARALGVSHGSVYRHFPSKADLRDAVAERWLARVSAPLADIAGEERADPTRLRRWLERLSATKREKRNEDPELFATYIRLVTDSREVVRAHVETLTRQLERIIARGVERGELEAEDPAAAARAVFAATARFHNPVHAAEWSDPRLGQALDEVLALLERGLRPGGAGPKRKRAPRGVRRLSRPSPP